MKTFHKFIQESVNSDDKELVLNILKNPKDWFVHLSYEKELAFEPNPTKARPHSVYRSEGSKTATSTLKPKLGFFLWSLENPKDNQAVKEKIESGSSEKFTGSAFSNRPIFYFLKIKSPRTLDLQNLTQEEYERDFDLLVKAKRDKLWSNLKIPQGKLFNIIEQPQNYPYTFSHSSALIWGESEVALLNRYFASKGRDFFSHILSKADFFMGRAPVSRNQIISRFLNKSELEYKTNFIFSVLKKENLLDSKLEKNIVYKEQNIPESVLDSFKKYLDTNELISQVIDWEKTKTNLITFIESQNDDLGEGGEVDIKEYIETYIQHREKLDNQSWNSNYGLRLWATLMVLSKNSMDWLHLVKDILGYSFILDSPKESQPGIITPFDFEIVGAGREGDLNRETMLTIFSHERVQAILLDKNIIDHQLVYKV